MDLNCTLGDAIFRSIWGVLYIALAWESMCTKKDIEYLRLYRASELLLPSDCFDGCCVPFWKFTRLLPEERLSRSGT